MLGGVYVFAECVYMCVDARSAQAMNAWCDRSHERLISFGFPAAAV